MCCMQGCFAHGTHYHGVVGAIWARERARTCTDVHARARRDAFHGFHNISTRSSTWLICISIAQVARSCVQIRPHIHCIMTAFWQATVLCYSVLLARNVRMPQPPSKKRKTLVQSKLFSFATRTPPRPPAAADTAVDAQLALPPLNDSNRKASNSILS